MALQVLVLSPFRKPNFEASCFAIQNSAAKGRVKPKSIFTLLQCFGDAGSPTSLVHPVTLNQLSPHLAPAWEPNLHAGGYSCKTVFTRARIYNGASYLANHLTANDYYAEGEKVTGHWIGRGAELLRGATNKLRPWHR